jgi:sarcosine oxidase
MNRRELSRTMMGGALMAAIPDNKQTYAVVGAGVFGSWTAHQILSAGHKVFLLDEYGPSSSRASSGGESRIIRGAYGPDEVYTRMAKRSLALWAAFFGQKNANLLRRAGVLWMAKSDNVYVRQSRETLEKVGMPFRDLSTADLKRLYPQIHIPDGTIAILEPESGALMARQAVQAVVQSFIEHGGIYHQTAIAQPRGKGKLESITAASGDRIHADAFIFACGPWLGKVFPDLLGNRIFVTRQEVLFFGVPAGQTEFTSPAMPVWIDFTDDRGMYGFPDLDTRGFKVAFDGHGPPFDPDSEDRFVRKEKVDEARRYVAERFPALAHAPVVDSRVCQYENTSNGDFLIDRHPGFDNVWLVGGGSGHGFKHGPAVGEYAAARITSAGASQVEPRFSLASKTTQQNRAVY